MMTPELAEQVRALIQDGLPSGLAGGVVTKFVVAAAVYTTDGEHAFGLLAPDEIPAWEVRGMLDYAHDMSCESTT